MSNIIIKEVENACKILQNGGVIVYPTDTVWGIGCDATNEEAVKKLYKIKQRNSSNPMLCLINGPLMLKKYLISVPDQSTKLLDEALKPTTIIYNHSINIPKQLLGENDSIGFRVVNNEFCKKLIEKLKKPIVSTSANLSGQITAYNLKEINTKILKEVDYVVNLPSTNSYNSASSIIKINLDGTISKIR
jgi:L-threonylcarbamoyladenylate synthase